MAIRPRTRNTRICVLLPSGVSSTCGVVVAFLVITLTSVDGALVPTTIGLSALVSRRVSLAAARVDRRAGMSGPTRASARGEPGRGGRVASATVVSRTELEEVVVSTNQQDVIGSLGYEVFVNEAPPQDGVLPNGEPRVFSPMASTLIYGREDAVLTDPGMTFDQARALGDWVAGKGKNLTDIFVTHGHGDHWFAAGLLAERFGARVVASPGTIAEMSRNAAMRPMLWDKVYPGLIPPSPVTAVAVPDNRFTVEGHELVIVEVGPTDAVDSTVLHVPDLDLVVAGDVIYNGVHMFLAQGALVGGFGPWREAIDKVAALRPRRIVAGHQNKQLDDDAERTIAETRQYLDDADELLKTEPTAVDFFLAKIERYPSHLGRTVLWAGASALYGVREQTGDDVGKALLSGWF
jgi:glyoxylase-like metal-dependent hydrolase (beta-lactamase superfamily II)